MPEPSIRARAWSFAHPRQCVRRRAGITASKKVKLRIIEAPASQPAHTTVHVSVPAGKRRHSAGQWVFLCIPRLGLTHWHPFTISCSAEDPELSLHFGGHGRWTDRVVALGREQDGEPVKVGSSALDSCERSGQLAARRSPTQPA